MSALRQPNEMNRAAITGLLMALLESRLRVGCCELIFFRFLEGVVAVAAAVVAWVHPRLFY